jgi:hypothetical protein
MPRQSYKGVLNYLKAGNLRLAYAKVKIAGEF